MRVELIAMALLWGAHARAGELYLTAQTTAFEDDRDDGHSDEDHNDVVVRWSAACDLDGSGLLVRQVVSLSPVAAGASRTNALVWILPAPTADVSLTVDGGPAQSLTPADGRVTLVGDLRDAFVTPTTGFVNTDGGITVPGRALQVTATWSPAVATAGVCPVPQLAIENELAIVEPDSTVGDNLRPLVGTFAGAFEPPREHVRIGVAYPGFLTWADDVANGDCDLGCASATWYLSPVPGAVTSRPDVAAEAPLTGFATCTDAVQNQGETDIDCGDPAGVCPACYETLVVQGGSKRWSDGTLATSCETYRRPPSGYVYDATSGGDGVYRVDPVGAAPSHDVYCDMTTDTGGWTLVDNSPFGGYISSRTAGAVTSLSTTKGAYLPGYTWSADPQLLCKSSFHPASGSLPWVTLRALTTSAREYPTQTTTGTGYSGATGHWQVVKLNNNVNYGTGSWIYNGSDRFGTVWIGAGHNSTCSCDYVGSQSGVGGYTTGDVACSTWVR